MTVSFYYEINSCTPAGNFTFWFSGCFHEVMKPKTCYPASLQNVLQTFFSITDKFTISFLTFTVRRRNTGS